MQRSWQLPRVPSIEECELCHTTGSDTRKCQQLPRPRLWIETVGEIRLYNYVLAVDLRKVFDDFM